MWYQVVKDCGEHRAGEVLDFGDPEAMLRLKRETGIQLEVVDGPVDVESSRGSPEVVAELVNKWLNDPDPAGWETGELTGELPAPPAGWEYTEGEVIAPVVDEVKEPPWKAARPTRTRRGRTNTD